MDSDSARGIDRRRLLRWGRLAAGAPLVGAQLGHATPLPTDREPSGDDRIPPDCLPGGGR